MRFNSRPYYSKKALFAMLLSLAATPALASVNYFSGGDSNPPFSALGDGAPAASPSVQDGTASTSASDDATSAQGDFELQGSGSGEPSVAPEDSPTVTDTAGNVLSETTRLEDLQHIWQAGA